MPPHQLNVGGWITIGAGIIVRSEEGQVTALILEKFVAQRRTVTKWLEGIIKVKDYFPHFF